ncbi:NAD(P)-dependent oxidoreductase [Micromonospora rosaria]|uniref:NAD(P)-dependent oxidoreductase n=1 Tax=Micromonospora rosaria TaxID=47874 RepID=A0A136PY44_9ACTN|nr:SDR family oxidoreductase [Micromonospora rosaria]KXK63283.1 NAD(P)-dependent oxidoreductase [Micromonospora rosaria]
MIVVTGATGQLGRLVVADLLARGVEPGRLVAAVRSPEKAADLAARGVVVREADYDRPDTVQAALSDADRVLLISSNAVGQRLEQHRAVVEAASRAGVSLLAYTSVLRADTSTLPVAPDHKATEELIRAAGLPFVLLRNGWYTENYTGNLAGTLAHGAVLGSAGSGRIAAATRADFAAAAAAVLTGDGPTDIGYELGGEPFTLAELAAEITRQSGTEVVYRDLPLDAYVAALTGAGLPEPFARLLADSDVAAADGALDTDSDDLPRLLGRPATSLADAVATALKD